MRDQDGNTLRTGKPVVGISSCLLGNKVRYDGGSALEGYLAGVASLFVHWIAVCPEVQCGLPVPRQPMHLEADPSGPHGVSSAPRLVETATGIDHTERMVRWAQGKLDELTGLSLCGFVFKSKSPSSAMKDARIFTGSGPTQGIISGAGIFARMFMDRFPHLPVEDEQRLRDPLVRENFFKNCFAMQKRLESADGECR